MNRGPLLMLIATFVLTCMSATVKVARSELGALDIVVWRSLFAIPFAWWFARRGPLNIQKTGTMTVRVCLGFGAMYCFFTALKGLPLADTNLITKLQPVLIALGAPLFLGRTERVEARTWLMLAVGVTGTAVLLAPDLTQGSVWGLWALASSVLSAGAHIALRGLKSERSEAVVFWLQIAFFLMALALVLMVNGRLTIPSARVWPALVGVGLLAAAGQLLMTRAYALDTASRVATVRFIGPVWGIILDVIFFGGWPAIHVWVGGTIVVGAGLAVTLKREHTREEG